MAPKKCVKSVTNCQCGSKNAFALHLEWWPILLRFLFFWMKLQFFLTHLWLSFLITWHWNRQKIKQDLPWGPVEAWRLCRKLLCVCCVCVCIVHLTFGVFSYTPTFHNKSPSPLLPPILPVCYLVAVHPRSPPSSPRYTSTTVFKKKKC